MSPRRRKTEYEYQAAPTEDAPDAGHRFDPPPIRIHKGSRSVRRLKRTALYLPLAILALFGLLHILLILLGRKSLFWDFQEYEQYLPSWRQTAYDRGNTTKDVTPIPCHSHNDYWRKVPLFDALHAGCISVEADVWLFKDNEELLVGHDTGSLEPDHTLASLYVDPLVELLDRMNPTTEFGKTSGHGVFDTDPDQTLVLLIDFKTDGHELFPRVRQQLEPLRKKGYLSFWDRSQFNSRAVTVVGTGNTPFDLVIANGTYRDIFFDAPLHELYEDPNPDSTTSTPASIRRDQGQTGASPSDEYDTSSSYYASTSLKAHVGLPWAGRFSASQLNLLRGQIAGAERRGLRSRYWETPGWPTSLRNHIWTLLVEEGVDILNVDDLQAAAKMDWEGKVGHTWIDA